MLLMVDVLFRSHNYDTILVYGRLFWDVDTK